MEICTINLGSALTRTANKYPDRVALVSHGGKRMTYVELDRLSDCFAGGLCSLGFHKGDHIAVLSLNCNEQLIAFFGILKMGGVVVPINVRLAAPEMEWIITHSDAKALIFSSDFKEQVNLIRKGLEHVEAYVILRDELGEGTLNLQEMLTEKGTRYQDKKILGDDVAFILYTAGTTGKPKGVELTHNGMIWNCVNWIYAGTYRENDLSLHVFPLYHVAALGSVLTYIFIGGTIYLKKKFDPKDCMETIERQGITRWAAAPTVFNILLQLPGIEKYDTTSLTMLGSGAAIMPGETQKKLRKLFPNAGIFDTYGMTEASGGITTLSFEDSVRKIGCVGKEHLSVEMRVVDENDNDVPFGKVGEIVFRGNNLMKGYYKNPEATAEALRDGWMHTGDLGRLDDEGFLYIVDRKKDMIITGGENVYPREVEEILYSHPKIAEAAVIGIPSAKWGQAIKAAVVMKPGDSASEEEIIRFCRERIAGFKCPKSVDFIPSLPKNPAGKILKRVLKEQYRNL